MSAIALVRVKRGSTWMILAPRALASIGHRMALRHVRAHHDDAVRVGHAPGIERRGAASEPCPQPGDAGGVSDPGLVLDGDDAEPAHQLLMDVVPLVVEGGA